MGGMGLRVEVGEAVGEDEGMKVVVFVSWCA